MNSATDSATLESPEASLLRRLNALLQARRDVRNDGALLPVRFVWHDRDSKFCASFRDTLRSAGVQPLSLPARSPNLNAFAESWVRAIKSEYLSKLVLFGELSLRRAVTQFIEHYIRLIIPIWPCC